MGKTVALGLVQMKMGREPSRNLANALKLISNAASKGADIVCLPELFLTPYFPFTRAGPKKLPPSYFESIPGNASLALSNSAKENAIALVAGSVYENAGKGLFNTSMVFNEEGKLRGIYRKMHVPHDEYFFERDYFAPGNLGFKVFNTSKAPISPLICYDQWFPEAARICALKGAQIIFYPTAIGTVKGISQSEGNWQNAWENAMRGHAIANNLVVAGVNRCGSEGKTDFWGGSFVCDAFGKTIGRLGKKEGILISEIDLEHGTNIRKGWKFFNNRRPNEYGLITK
ncbi:MAG: nitrilase-related carbon-nitrogen hydrolase [Candidatus Micrarchaeota archaeon]